MTLRRLGKRLCFFMIVAGLTVSFVPAGSPAAEDVPRMTIQELKAKMDRGENIVILDVRSGEDYAASKVKITGAIRIPLVQLEGRYKELLAGREIITYCA
jgi:sulfur-carrier protein adenylyltransferase/sulfurtransferase